MVRTLDLRLRGRGFNFLQASCSHTCTVVSGTGTGLRAVMPCDWEGNRRSGIALAMRHSLKWFTHLRAQWPSHGDKHLVNALLGAWSALSHQCKYSLLLHRR